MKKKRGRPKVPNNRKKIDYISIRVTPREKVKFMPLIKQLIETKRKGKK